MVLKQCLEKFSLLKNQSEMTKLIYIYRYLSLFITSLAYLSSNTNNTLSTKIFFVSCIAISSILVNYLYVKNQGLTEKIKLIVFIETIGNTLILIPSGGIDSPYVWYSLNTILIATVELELKYCWINLLIYLFGSTWISYRIFLIEETEFIHLIFTQFNLILSLVLITVAIQILVKYVKKAQRKSALLSVKNKQLLLSNNKIKKSLNHIMELYEAVHLFTSIRDKEKIIKLILKYTKKITFTNAVVFYDFTNKSKIYVDVEDLSRNIRKELEFKKTEICNKIINGQESICENIANKKFVFVSIKANHTYFGLLGIQIDNLKQHHDEYREIIEHLQFLSQLSAITFERFELEKLNEGLLVAEEQNRIASEIHDNVLQRLFGVSCGIYSIMKNSQSLTSEEVNSELNIIRSCIDNSMKDLRTAIYGLSWQKDGINTFLVDIMNYINETKSLYKVKINLKLEGNDQFLSCLQKKAIYRIICEGTSNGIRHGEADQIDVILNMDKRIILLKIIDNGLGFNYKDLDAKKIKGLGLKNIQYLVSSLKGELSINSKINKGTKLLITIPNNHYYTRGEVI